MVARMDAKTMTTSTTNATRVGRLARLALTLAVLVLVLPVGDVQARRCACVRSCCSSACGSCLLRPACKAGCEDSCLLDCGNPDLDLTSAFDSTVTILSRDGRNLALSGPIACADGARIKKLRVTVTQNGALAEGSTRGACAGADQHWALELKASGGGFVAGPALACGLAVVQSEAGAIDTHQWCTDVVLAGETD